ncbi:MAG TPA: PhzF family phenazine biosynthesis protein [Steroidobacteraceae bacterium]
MSTALHYRLVNVFTREGRALSGNPLCVFEDGNGLSDGVMQALARQFNLSETTFLLPSTKASVRVRIFTPNYELPFAGHPTLGSAHVCRALKLGGDNLSLEMQAGIIPVAAEGSRWTLSAQSPSWRDVELPRARLAQLLGLADSDLLDRPLWVKAGNEQLIVPLASEAAVRKAAPDRKLFETLVSVTGQAMAYVFAPAQASGGTLARFFFPQGAAVLEDPATGSACANLGGWWLAMCRDLPYKALISQGELVGRPSTLYLDVDANRQIQVGGEVIELGRGSITL